MRTPMLPSGVPLAHLTPAPITSDRIKSLAGQGLRQANLTPAEQQEVCAPVLAHIEPRANTTPPLNALLQAGRAAAIPARNNLLGEFWPST